MAKNIKNETPVLTFGYFSQISPTLLRSVTSCLSYFDLCSINLIDAGIVTLRYPWFELL